MGYDITFCMYDREKIDPILNRTLKSFSKKISNRKEKILIDKISFCTFDEISNKEAEYRFKNYTIMELMKESYESLYLLEGIIANLFPKYEVAVCCRGLSTWIELIGIAARAFLEGRLSKSATSAVFKLICCTYWTIIDIFTLKKSDKTQLFKGIDWHNFYYPIYKWLNHEPETTCHLNPNTDLVNCLGATQSRLFLNFLQKVYNENWLPLKVKKNWLDWKSEENIKENEEFIDLKETFCNANFNKPSITFFIN